MRVSIFRSSVVLAFAVAACSPEAPKPVAPIPANTEPKKSGPVASAEDRTPVEAPGNLVAQAHAQSLRALVKSVRGYLPASAPALDPRAIVHDIGDGTLDRVVDVDKPADVAVVLPEQGKNGKPPIPIAAFAFGIEDGADVANAVKDSYDVEARPGGVMALVTRGMKTSRCVIAPAIGPAKHRLVCALEGDPMVLAPWLSRGVTRAPESNVPLRGEVDVARIRKTFASELEKARAVIRTEAASDIRTGFAEIDRVLKTWAKGAVDEAFDLLEDVDRLTLDVALPAEGAQPTFAMVFGGTKSWLARVMLAGGDTLAAPSKQLGKMPGDSAWLAGYSRATPQSDALAQPFQTALKDLVDAASAEFKWPAKDRDAALEVVKTLFPAAADASFLSGYAGKVELPDSTPTPRGLGKALARAFLSKTFSVSAVERDAKAPIALAKALAAWAVKPSFAQTYRTLTGDRMTVKVNVKQINAKDMPKGSFGQHLDLDLGVLEDGGDTKSKKGAKAKETSVAKLGFDSIIVPEGTARSWVGFSQNLGEGELWKKLQGAMSGSTTSPVSSIPGYDFATTGTPTGGALMAVDATVKSLDLQGNKTNEILSQLPDGGRTALAWRITPSKPPKATSDVAVFVPRDLISAVYLAFMRL